MRRSKRNKTIADIERYSAVEAVVSVRIEVL